jgi:NTE family protein
MSEPGNGTKGGREKYVDLVFEGGGVKGIALVGAFSLLEGLGYEPQNMAGASAGAIVAALIAAGYGADELKEIVANLDYDQFKDQAIEDRLPMGKTLSILKDLGIYEGEAFEGWMRGLLEAHGVRTFGDLVRREDVDLKYRYKLQVIASDVTERRLLVACPKTRRASASRARTTSTWPWRCA